MITVIIIDDEQDCIDDLQYLFKKLVLPVEVVATATSGDAGLDAIRKYQPQLVFLDVVMPGMSGFEMLELLPKADFHLIITTAADKYAIQAIRASAMDFLLKPVKAKELKDAVERSVENTQHPGKTQIDLLAGNLRQQKSSIKKIALTIADGVQLVNLDDIIYFKSDGNYTTVYMKGGNTMLVSKPIGRFEEITDPAMFFRVHNSYLVNLNCISKYLRSGGGHIVLDNGETITVARSRKDEFLELFGKL